MTSEPDTNADHGAEDITGNPTAGRSFLRRRDAILDALEGKVPLVVTPIDPKAEWDEVMQDAPSTDDSTPTP